MATGICKSPDSRYWRALYKCALSEIGKTTRAHCRSREGGCAKGAGVVSGCQRQRRRDRGSGGRDVCLARLRQQLSGCGKGRPRVSSTGSHSPFHALVREPSKVMKPVLVRSKKQSFAVALS